MALLGSISFFYAWKIPIKNSNLRDLPHVKIYLIAIVWASTSVILPSINQGIDIANINYILFLANFLFIIAITIPFDIRDKELDEKRKLTIPQILGIRNAKIVAIILMTITYALIINITDSMYLNFALGFCYLISFVLIMKSSIRQHDHYYSFGIDGILVLQTLLIYLTHSL